MRMVLCGALVAFLGVNVAWATDITPTLIDPWKSGDAKDECLQAGGCGEFAYKVDNWNEQSGREGDYQHSCDGLASVTPETLYV